MTIDHLSFNVLIYCVLPLLRDGEIRALSMMNKRLYEIVRRYCLADKSSITELCLRGDLLIIYKRELVVKDRWIFGIICKRRYVNLVKKSIKFCEFNINDVDDWLGKACRGGNKEIVDLMVSLLCSQGYVYNWNTGLYSACRGGHKEIVNLMIILLGDYKDNVHWRRGLEGACHGGNRETIDLMVSLLENNRLDNNGSDNKLNDELNNNGLSNKLNNNGLSNKDIWNAGLYGACQGGHREIVNLMIDKGADYWSGGLYGACRGGHKEIAEIMIKKGAIYCSWCFNPLEEHIKKK